MFQPFFVDLNLPVALTRGDEVSVPVVVYNYLDKPQTVELTLAGCHMVRAAGAKPAIRRSTWQPARSAASASASGPKRSAAHESGGDGPAASGVADAVKRPIEVVPDGRARRAGLQRHLQQPAEIDLSVPEGGHRGQRQGDREDLSVELQPARRRAGRDLPAALRLLRADLVHDLSQRPGARTTCGGTARACPQVEAKARQYIHLGYQRLLSFEIRGGGFDWFGRPPANRTLTAYGLMEFQDMARVHDVDPKLIERTRQWLLGQQRADGSWDPEGHMLHEDPTRRPRRPLPGSP